MDQIKLRKYRYFRRAQGGKKDGCGKDLKA